MADQRTQKLITVLGASGLLGTAVTRELAALPVQLRLIGRREIIVPECRQADVETFSADLTEAGAVADAVANTDAVVHLISHSSGLGTWRVATGDLVAERVNLGLVCDVLDAIRRQRRDTPPVMLFAGSVSQDTTKAAANGDGATPDEPATAYDRQKLAAERVIAAATVEGIVRGSTLRLSTLYSQGIDPTHLDRGVVAAMTRRALAGEPLTMWHGGTAKRDLLCVDDAARAFVAALDTDEALARSYWPLGSGQQISIADLFTMIAKVASAHTGHPPSPVVSTPPPKHALPTDQVDFVSDSAAFRQVTGWSPRVRLREGLDHLAEAMTRESVKT